MTRLESQALANYRGFRWRVCAYMAWGYFLMGFLFLLIVGIAALLLVGRMLGMAIRYLRFGAGFAKGLCKGLWIKVKPVEEIQIERMDSEPLFQMIDEICQQLHAPPIHSVYLAPECNAFARQTPKIGPFGPFRNTVMIGLPLLAMMDREELRGVIAHEIGHIHKGHSRFALRVSQVSGAWEGAVNESRGHAMNAAALSKVVDWYSPWLSAARIVLARMAEREANLAEASVAGENTSARISVAMALFPPQSSEVWKKLMVDSYTSETPPPNAATHYFEALAHPAAPAVVEERLVRALNEPDDPFASHPNLTRLLEAVKVQPTIENVLRLAGPIQTPRQSAGEALFGVKLGAFLAKVDRDWEKRHAEYWSKQRKKHLDTEGKVAALLQTAREKPPTNDERIELAGQLYNLGRTQEALQWLAGLSERNRRTRYLHALILRDLGNPHWVPQMERVVTEVEFEVPASNYLISYYNELGDRPNVQRLYDGLQKVAKSNEDAALHRNTLTGPWIYSNCNWNEERRAQIRQALMPYKDISKAFLADRSLKDGRRRHTIVVVQRKFISVKERKKLLQEVAQSRAFSGSLVFTVDKLPASIAQVPGSLVYDANDKSSLLPS